ncbi:geranylgeranyl reductase [Acidimicrobium ferrooxidans DSM 10331]|uniref:Geranylgeranyl reductase n=1 Tax=Acidimicrobium ferrooxidans (strain DSM 10331 / JCM 15462 / NBRC 103882 / ICP) TaxID=525909 RepID=C7M2T6_ACIFD|nr:geranylgeranyl reductase family protein [Acidimicrobium ferrooxidans]ACU53330.1 geranylgeranyl reductase [Acidimicrobium ferrooxidans DSM 10331]
MVQAVDEEVSTTVVVVGGGPSGASCAHWLAMRGIDVVVLERKQFPRDKVCGDGLTPRSVVQLEALGLGAELEARFHRYEGLRAVAFGRTLDIPWPNHPLLPSYGFVARRRELDALVVGAAADRGATVLFGHEGIELERRGNGISAVLARRTNDGAVVRVRARWVVLAEGSNARLARSLGAIRDTSQPLGLAIRTYLPSSRSDEPWIESALDVRDESGRVMPGYGWVFPMGDGSVNIGFGLLTNQGAWRHVNTTTELARFVDRVRDRWGLDVEHPLLAKPVGGKLPMGTTIKPVQGSNYLLVGDTAATINPFNGEGISYALETGRLAATLIAEARRTDSDHPLTRYPALLGGHYGTYYALGRRFVRLISDPRVMAPGVWLAMRNRATMAPVVSVMANLLPPSVETSLRRAGDLGSRVRTALGRSTSTPSLVSASARQ